MTHIRLKSKKKKKSEKEIVKIKNCRLVFYCWDDGILNCNLKTCKHKACLSQL